jgi:mitochondrial ribonuclease P protein 3
MEVVGSAPDPPSSSPGLGTVSATVTAALPAAAKSQPARKVKTKHTKPEVLAARKKIQMCCATNDLATALEVYHASVANDTRIEAQSFYSLLNLCASSCDDHHHPSRVHIGTPKLCSITKAKAKTTAPTTATSGESESSSQGQILAPMDLETCKQAAFVIKLHMDRIKIPLNETAYTALVRLLAKAHDLQAAETILTEAEGVQQCRVKLRLYSSLITACCQMRNLHKALELWQRLSQQGLVLTEKEYATLMECCALVGDANVMQKLLTDLAEDVLVPAKNTCQAIVQWFQSPYASSATTTATTTESDTQQCQVTRVSSSVAPLSLESADATPLHDPLKTQELLSKIVLTSSQQSDPVYPIGPVTTSATTCSGTTHHDQPMWLISDGCHIDPQTGMLQDGCLKGKALQPVKLSPEAWQKMIDMNEEIVLSGKLDKDTSQFQGGKKGRKRKLGDRDQEERKRLWQEFQSYLQHQHDRQQQTSQNSDTIFDVVIDGANVGYFQTNYVAAPKHVDYCQIDSVVQHLQELHKRVLLVMHHRHFGLANMPKRFIPVVQSWERAGILCKTPPGMNDDWFWMHAALVSGPGTLVLTNDEMRDHHFQMLAPRSFLRWKERHRVRFHFGGDDSVGKDVPPRRGPGRQFFPIYPERYSRRIQRVADGYAIPLPKQGDQNRFLDGGHFAEEAAPAEESYLCIRPVTL